MTLAKSSNCAGTPVSGAAHASSRHSPNLIVFSHLRWDFVYQRPQQLLSRLARWQRVLFIEEPVHCEGPPRFERWTPCAGVQVLRPRTPVEAAGFHDDQLPFMRALLVELLAEEAIEDCVAWFYTPMALPLLSQLAPRAVVYDCMDDLAAAKGAARQMRQRESALMKVADLVLTGGPSLFEARRDLHPNVHCLPSAVDARHFAPRGNSEPAWDEGRQEISPAALAASLQGGIPGPRLGYFGVVDERLDLGLIAALADHNPSWQLVMVGPVANLDAALLPRRPNIHWLGQQPYTVLPELAAGWDVCLLPFAMNERSRFICPTKTLEYMATEKPIVSTGIRDVRMLYGEVVRFGDTHREFIEACRAALEEAPRVRAERVAATLACVSRFSWDASADVVHTLLDRAVAARPNGAAPAPAARALITATPLDGAIPPEARGRLKDLSRPGAATPTAQPSPRPPVLPGGATRVA